MANNFFEVTDPRGKKIICTNDCWQKHILAKHPFLSGWEKDIEKAIKKPDAIYKDANFPDTENYYKKTKKCYIKVPVKFNGDNGNTRTAFFCDSPKTGEVLIWTK